MFAAIARFDIRFRWLIVAGWLVGVIAGVRLLPGLTNASVVEIVTKTAQAVSGFGQTVNCTPSSSPIAWTATVMSNNTVPFGKGNASVGLDATATDPNFHNNVTQHVDAVVRLR